jgi:hypothetical protein
MLEAATLPRPTLLRRGYLLEIATIAWNIAEGIVAVTAGTQAHKGFDVRLSRASPCGT